MNLDDVQSARPYINAYIGVVDSGALLLLHGGPRVIYIAISVYKFRYEL